MKLRRLQLPAISILLFFTSSYAQEISPKAVASKPITDIRQVDFKNFTYRVEWEKERPSIELRRGSQDASNGVRFGLMRTTYGDLTGDGSDEAIILLRGQNTRISRTLDEVFIYTLKSREVSQLDHFEAGRRGDYVLSVESLNSNFKVEDGVLILDQAVWRKGEHFPTHYYTIKYRWNGVELAEVERSRLKPIPDGMREIG